MNIELNEKELVMLQSAITAKIKRCRHSMNNNARNPTAKSEDQMRVRAEQMTRFTELCEKLKVYEPEEI